MAYDYIIVQAGGKGTRMDYLTKNKPKALVSVHNLPMLFYLFKKFPDKKFIIIGDYKIDVLRKYLEVFAETKYLVVNANGKKGTCAGISDAIDFIPENNSFMLIWSDLILPEHFKLTRQEDNYIGISKGFPCRWSYKNDLFYEEVSEEYGVAGFFLFKDKSVLKEIPDEGEFVRWLQENGKIFKEIDLYQTKEYGLIEKLKETDGFKCRPFNKITCQNQKIIKQGIDEQGKKLAEKEAQWYKKAEESGFHKIPKIFSYDPIVMERINGKNIYEYDFNQGKKQDTIKNIVNLLSELHSIDKCEKDSFSLNEAYIAKTFKRLNKIKSLLPFADEKLIIVNGVTCRNVFFYFEDIWNRFLKMDTKEFKFIHGDCTFSNIILKDDTEPVLVDPRGYFGFTKYFGDELYDWAKLYYSIKGNYDQFNLKRFRLTIGNREVNLNIESNQWECVEDYFFSLLPDYISRKDIQFIHAIIWLSLTTYVWDDYDSICSAFYNGLYYMEEVL